MSRVVPEDFIPFIPPALFTTCKHMENVPLVTKALRTHIWGWHVLSATLGKYTEVT